MAARGQCERALARFYTRKEGDLDVKGKPKTRLYVYRPLAAPWLIQKQGPKQRRALDRRPDYLSKCHRMAHLGLVCMSCFYFTSFSSSLLQAKAAWPR